MGKIQKKIKPGWWLPIEVKDSFTDFCDKIGNHIQDNFAGAIWIWPLLPAQIREWAKLEAKGESAVDADFWKGFQEGMNSQIQHLIESHHQKKEA